MSYVGTALLMFFSVIVMTIVHEAAHMITAKIFKIPVVEFAVGFGPKIFSKQYGETKYSLRLLPFGGYCSFTDPDDTDSKIDRAVSDKNLYDVPSWQRALVLLAGPISNIALAFLCMFAAGINPVETCRLVFGIGVTFIQNIYKILDPALLTSGGMMVASFQMADMVLSSSQVLRAFWIVSGSINLLLGLTNLLPFPALDGFSAVWALAESLLKRKFSQKIEGKLKFAGMLVIYAMMFFCCIGDILHAGNYLNF